MTARKKALKSQIKNILTKQTYKITYIGENKPIFKGFESRNKATQWIKNYMKGKKRFDKKRNAYVGGWQVSKLSVKKEY